MLARAIRSFLCAGFVLVGGSVAHAQDAGQPGECATGFCGTPKNNGGGGGGGGGGSILVNNTDIGKTYSKTDDYDADGIADDFDNCTFVANRDQADSDGDKIGDACDNCPQAANPDQRDVNANAVGDACDPDIDGDKLLNGADNCPSVPNVSQADTNKNGIGDACDPDMDGDGVPNAVDNCPLVPNADQAKDAPGRFGSACDTDQDKDAIEDAKDNCVAAFNPDQLDTNKNGLGDACDPDMDGDMVANQVDNCPLVPNPDQKDADKDLVGDACQAHGFCFVAGKNRDAKCLDPKSVFAITAAPHPVEKVKTGTTVFPTLYANREKVSIRYSWVVLEQPAGSNEVVKNALGTVVDSEGYEYRYVIDDQRPSLVLTHAGSYRLRLAADLVKDDPLFPSVAHAEAEVSIEADGPTASSGCGVARGRADSGAAGGALAAIAIVLGLLMRRRRIAG